MTSRYIDLWFDSLFEHEYRRIQTPITVLGEFRRNLGAMGPVSASIKFSIEHAEELDVVDAIPIDDETRKYVDSAVFGFLDAVMTVPSFPKKNIRIVVQAVDVHPVESFIWTFREAGRDAGAAVLKTWSQWIQLED